MSIFKKLVIGLLKSTASRYLDEAKLSRATAAKNPIDQFANWFALAKQVDPEFANAMVLSTAATGGQPASRLVLLKDFDEQGFVFFTNYGSRKAAELAANPQANLVFWWKEVYRQVRVEGRVEKVSRAESEAYFASRPRGSQIGAWASRQSTPLACRADFEGKIAQIEARFKGQEVPCPPFWGGYRLTPQTIEFWQGRESRLHDRLCYQRGEGGSWQIERLSP